MVATLYLLGQADEVLFLFPGFILGKFQLFICLKLLTLKIVVFSLYRIFIEENVTHQYALGCDIVMCDVTYRYAQSTTQHYEYVLTNDDIKHNFHTTCSKFFIMNM